MSIFMPPTSIIHYKSAFDIISNDDQMSTYLRKSIRQWLKNRKDMDTYGKEKISKYWFFTGNQDQDKCGECYIRTSSVAGKYTEDNPEYWVIEIIHYDSLYKNRLWSVNIGIIRVDKDTIRFSCMVRYGIKSNYIGNIPPNPDQTTPLIIKEILSNDKFECFKFGTKINYRCYDAAVFGGKWLADEICNSNRRLPIIVYCKDECDIDFDKLAHKNLGNANFYIISDNNTMNNFNRYLPYDHRIEKGMIRVYYKFINEENSGSRHRFYISEDIYNNFEDIKNNITFAISKNSANFFPNEIYSISQVIEKRRLYNIEKLRINSENRDNKEYISLLEEELDDKTKLISSLEECNLSMDEQISELENKIHELEWQAGQYSHLNKKVSLLQQQIASFQKEFDIPQSLEEVLILADSFWNDKLEITDSAKNSAKNYEYKNDHRIVKEAWNMINKLCTTMYSLKFIEKSNDLENSFTSKTGINFSMTEGKQTKKDKKFVLIRKCEWKGEEYYFFPHLKSNIRSDFRMHISFIEKSNKILLCHCGKHLDNAKTRYIN